MSTHDKPEHGKAHKTEGIVVKRYARSRFYDTENQRYVTLEQLRMWAQAGIPFSVIDTESGEDITRVLQA
ncbi:MAG TPA: polyhydroxyalkanoate synthesis regulator DNA-binding domain-containing protein [Acidisphaera sp.]|nr:polyhydroxyalkanoate synthesis regulator DNA-binding domain-containing protein [Acidisphaera sp.]